jgi:hypothetical protein
VWQQRRYLAAKEREQVRQRMLGSNGAWLLESMKYRFLFENQE